MRLPEYVTATDATAIYPGAGTGELRAIVYTSLGLAGESSEVVDKVYSVSAPGDRAGLLAELGDVAWYLARLHRELGLPIDRTVTAAADRPLQSEHPCRHLTVYTGRIAEAAKKALRDDNATLTDDRRTRIIDGLVDAYAAWSTLVRSTGARPEDVVAANIAKLLDRKARHVLTGSGDTR